MSDKKFKLLEKLLPHIEKYVESGGEADPIHFANWVKGEELDIAIPKRDESAPFDPASFMKSTNPKAAFSFYLTRLNKYAKYYLKEAFAGTPIKSADDFAYVASLAYAKGLSKSELIRMNVGETSGGMDIIKRLEKDGMIESFQAESDKRSKHMRLTPQGQGIFFSVLPNLARVGEIVRAHLGDEDVAKLVEILSALDSFHKNIYECEKEYNLDVIEREYLK